MIEHIDSVRVWEESVVFPTYRIGEPDKNPMFLEKRVYQGSSGVVYPYPIIERIFDEKIDQTYQAIFLENQYLKIMLLPQLGGRVHMALDKTNGYHFVYYNHVIKPALVGLTGPWISGGIEFNWPQHHRPSTFLPVEYTFTTNSDGSQTVWLSEIEVMFRTKGMAGFTLYPDRAYLEINVQLSNRTPFPQTFLWWANPAVSVNDDYQSIFPPDVHAVMDHGKRDVSTFPIATGTYYKVNYAPGTDISRYKNIPVPTSYMAYHSDFDFLGCYDHGIGAGMMHIANHHLVPGKKQWTWGCGEFGQAWDRQLTDEDGPYIELMCGAFTDNQPDFSWLQPGEEKQFTQIFMPYKGTGGAKNANREAVINLEVSDDDMRLSLYVTRTRTVKIQLLHGTEPIFERELALSPLAAFTQTIKLEPSIESNTLSVSVWSDGEELIRCAPLAGDAQPIPAPATPALPPDQIVTTEALFLNGLHLEQYRHATYEPETYYREALRRDPHDSRCNNALGRLLLRRGKFADAETYFRTAVQSLTGRNPNPYDGEPFYNLGLSLRLQGRYAEAYDAFYKSVWNAAWQDSGYFELARLASRAGRLVEALEHLDHALARNLRHHQARHLRSALLRSSNRSDEARAEIAASLALDPLNLGALYEQDRLNGSSGFLQSAGNKPSNYIEIALDYAHAGLFQESVRLLQAAPGNDPMVSYFLGWMHTQIGAETAATQAFEHAASLPIDYCFPNQIEAVLALQTAIRRQSSDAHAPYALGNFWYAHRCYADAIACWERARDLDPHFPTVQRNLALAYANKQGDLARAQQAIECAFALDTTDARVLFELDQLSKKRNVPSHERLALLDSHWKLVLLRDDLTIEYVTLLNVLGQHQRALDLLLARQFHPWEGGEGKVIGQYVLTLVELAKECLQRGSAQAAIGNLERALVYPTHLGEGKLFGAQENNLFYYLGCAHEQLGDWERASANFTRASMGLSEPSSPKYYNDQPPEMIYYQGMARRKLQQIREAESIFHKLIDYGQQHLHDEVQIDYFAVSLPDFLVFDEDLNRRNRIHAHYMLALGYSGLGQIEEARAHFAQVLTENVYHLGAISGLAALKA